MAKNNNIWRIVSMVFLISITLLGAAIAYGVLSERVMNNTDDIELTAQAQKELADRTGESEKVIIRMQTDISYIKKGIDRIEKKIRSEERRVGKEGRSRWSPYH